MRDLHENVDKLHRLATNQVIFIKMQRLTTKQLPMHAFFLQQNYNRLINMDRDARATTSTSIDMVDIDIYLGIYFCSLKMAK